MWLSSRTKPAAPTADADLGVTTIAGNSVGVVTRGEVRALPVYGPGGYVWLPENGTEVLVIKGGPGGEEQCVAGCRQKAAPPGMRPGEVRIQGPGGSGIYLRRDGSVEITGQTVRLQGAVEINGVPYKPCTCGEEAGI